MANELNFLKQSDSVEILFYLINKQTEIMQKWSPYKATHC